MSEPKGGGEAHELTQRGGTLVGTTGRPMSGPRGEGTLVGTKGRPMSGPRGRGS